MSTEIDSLYWKAKIDYDGLKTDIDKINSKISGMASTTEKETSKMEGYFKKAFAAIAAIGLVAILTNISNNVINMTSQFEKFDAVLTNSFGNASQAQNALNNIQNFAANTPYQVTELTDSFIKLRNQGFTPTMAEMTKMGDLAASTGKSFGQLTEGILDASMGEWERMKEFGVKAKQEGDKVTIMFKGQKDTIDNNAESVRNYIVGLGALKGVAGTMSSISATIGGQISNLQDSVDAMYNNIGKANKGIITTGLTGLKSLVDGANEYFKNIAWAKGLDDIANLSKASKEQADTATTLLARYKELTKDGLTPTAEKKKELTMILTSLKDMFGKNVLEIDKETGAYKLNTEEINKNIEAKLNAADENKLKLAGEIRAANQLNELKKEERIAAQKDLDAYNAMLSEKYGIAYNNSRLPTTVDWDKRNAKKSPDDLQEISRLTKLAWLKVDQLKALNSVIQDQSEKVTDSMKAFKKAGYTESDYYNLTRSGKVGTDNADYTSGNSATEAAARAAREAEAAAKLQSDIDKKWNAEAIKNEKARFDAMQKNLESFNKSVAKAEQERYQNHEDTIKNIQKSRLNELNDEMEYGKKLIEQYQTKNDKLKQIDDEYKKGRKAMSLAGASSGELSLYDANYTSERNKIITEDDLKRLERYANSVNELTRGFNDLATVTGGKVFESLSKVAGATTNAIDSVTQLKKIQQEQSEQVSAAGNDQAAITAANTQAIIAQIGVYAQLAAALKDIADKMDSAMKDITGTGLMKAGPASYLGDLGKAADWAKGKLTGIRQSIFGKSGEEKAADAKAASLAAQEANTLQLQLNAKLAENALITVKAGSDEEIALKKKAIEEKAWLDIDSAMKEIKNKELRNAEIKRIELQANKDIADIDKAANEAKKAENDKADAQKLESELNHINAKLAIVKKGSDEEHKLLFDQINKQKEIDIASINATTESAQIKNDKIADIVATSNAEIVKLNNDFLEKQYQAKQEYIAQLNNIIQSKFGTTAKELADAIKSGLEQGKSLAETFSGDLNSLLRNAILNAYETKLIQPKLDQMMNDVNKYIGVNNGNGLTDAQKAEKIKAAYGVDSEWYKQLQEYYGYAQDAIKNVLPDTTSNTTPSSSIQGMSGAIKSSMTEDTASLLAGQTNAMRIDIKTASIDIKKQTDIAMQGVKQLQLIEINTRPIKEIRDLIKNGSGRAVGI